MLKATAKDLFYIRTDAENDGLYITDETEIAGAGRDMFTGYGLVDAGAAVAQVEKPRFIIRNRLGKAVASFFSDGDFSSNGDYFLREGYGPIDYGGDGAPPESGPNPDRIVPNSSDGGGESMLSVEAPLRLPIRVPRFFSQPPSSSEDAAQ